MARLDYIADLLRAARATPANRLLERVLRALCDSGARAAAVLGRGGREIDRFDPGGVLPAPLDDVLSAETQDAMAGNSLVCMPVHSLGRHHGWLVVAQMTQAERDTCEQVVAPLVGLLLPALLAATAADRCTAPPESFVELITREVDRCRAAGRPCSVVHISPATNGGLVEGQLAGLAEDIALRIRPSDRIGWLAPDRLGLLLPEVDSTGALVVARRLEHLSAGRGAPGALCEPRTFPADCRDVAALVAAPAGELVQSDGTIRV